MSIHEKLAQELREADQNYAPIEQISKRYPELTMDDAYKIQLINVDQIVAEGAKITGKKIGLTSKAMQESLGVETPDFGFLYDSMEVQNNTVPKDTILQPRVEGELAFVLKEDLNGDVTLEDVMAATDYIVPAIEVVGTRIKDWKLTIVDTVADNASCGMYVLSDRKIYPGEVDLKDIEMTLYRNGEKINSGFGSAVLGDPANAVAWLAKCMGRYGVSLNAGDIILSGALSAAISADPGDEFVCSYGPYGDLAVKFE